jgi:hypothetical protein
VFISDEYVAEYTMAKKQPARRATKAKSSKPPKDTREGVELNKAEASADTRSATENFPILVNAASKPETQAAAERLMEKARELGIVSPNKEARKVTVVDVKKNENAFLSEWKSRKGKLHDAERGLRELPDSEYENIIREMIRVAPTAWHLKKLILEAVRWLKWLSRGNGDHSRGIPANNDNVIANVHYELARITHEFNVSLTAKSTPRWLQLAKKHPAFQKAWKLHQRTKGEHQHDSEYCRVIEVDSYGGQKLRCVFEENVVHMEWQRGVEVTRQETRERISSNGVLQHWLADVLRGFDEWMDNPGSPLAEDWAKRWANEELYMKHFMLHAEQEWNPDEVDELQALACGLLTTNNGKKDGKPRYDFGAFKTRIKRLAIHQIRVWRDGLVPPAPKV